MDKTFDNNRQLILKREEVLNTKIDIGGRDIIIGFNEPAFKSSSEDGGMPMDSKLNARFISYFLPAVEVARQQTKRPRLILVSGLNIALKWNSSNETEKKIMTINSNLKFDFLNQFFNRFFPNTFSIIEYIIAQDPIKIDEDKLLKLWYAIEQKYQKEIYEIKFQLARFKRPKLFNREVISEEGKKYLDSNDPELLNSFKYAISHLLVLGDINFEANVIHNPIGYLSIGGQQEKTFNIIRSYAYELLQSYGEEFFGRKIITKDNLKLVLENKEHTPPAYNGYFRKNGDRLFLDEVTYENSYNLDFYDNHKKLKFEMEYMYEHLVPKKDYKNFWEQHRTRYFELKSRYKEAYNLEQEF